MEHLRQFAEHGLAFWFMASAVSPRESFWNTAAGRFILAILPGIITAALTATVTVGSIYLSMRDNMIMIQSGLTQVQHEHTVFAAQQDTQDKRLIEAEKDLARIKGKIEK